MLNNNSKNNGSGCFSAEDLMSYLYDEITPAERNHLDVHLAGCRTCTEDFATVSESRFSIYEWQRNDFAALQTPTISGPWENTPIRQVRSPVEPSPVSWIERAMVLLDAYRSWAFTAAAFGVLVVGAWFGLLILRGSTRQDQAPQARANTEDPAVVPVSNDPAPQIAVVKETQKKDIRDVPVKAAERRPATPNSVTVADNRQNRRRHQNPVDLNGRKSEMASVRKAPNLSGIEEDEDRSVRLADLFAEVGSENEDN